MVVKCFATIWFARNIAFAVGEGVGEGECKDGNCEPGPVAGRVLLQHKQSVETVKEDVGVGVLEDMLSEHDMVFMTPKCLKTPKSFFGRPWMPGCFDSWFFFPSQFRSIHILEEKLRAFNMLTHKRVARLQRKDVTHPSVAAAWVATSFSDCIDCSTGASIREGNIR